jgi:uncharacterized protein
MEIEMKAVNVITLALIIVGAVNWGSVGLFETDLVASLFGGQSAPLARLVYTIVGICGIYQVFPLATALSNASNNPPLAHGHR